MLIKVQAAGVNRPDVLQRMGLYPPPPGASNIPGLEVAGEVAALGEGVSQWRIGDRVTALTAGGGYAEYTLAHEGSCLSVPKGLSMAEAACIPETFMTVWHNVFERGALKAGECFLVHGGSSGIGSTAIQLAAHSGARVFATAGSDEKCAYCESLGAERAINYKTQSFAKEIKEATCGRGVDVILDMVGGDLCAGRHRLGRRRRPHRPDRFPQGRARATRPHAPHAEAADADGIHAAPAEPRVQGPARAGASREGVAARRKRIGPDRDR